MNHPPDPGGVFASDTHRRVLGSLPTAKEDPVPIGDLVRRVAADAHTLITEVDQLQTILEDLAAAGFCKELKAGWRMTAEGVESVCGPVANEPPPLEGEALAAAEEANEAMAAEAADAEAAALEGRIDRAKGELKAAEAAKEES